MQESLFNSKITLSTPTGLSPVKVDITKTEMGVEIRLIDTSNIFSLWTYTLTSSDFYILKRDQDILVDYDRFIQVLVNLFHGVSTARYSAVFNEGLLKFIENTEFRNIVKLELKFSKPEESQYRRYLGDIISRMESDNVKLIKENSLLRDRCRNGDRELREKVSYMETETVKLRRMLEMSQQECRSVQEHAGGREEEITRLTNKIYSLENENAQLRYEVERYQRDNSVSIKEQLRTKESEMEELSKEISTANEIIRKLRQENGDLKQFKTNNLESVQKEADRNEELSVKMEEAQKKMAQLEGKYKKLKEEVKEKTQKIDELSENNKMLTRRLENAQNVYNHFYSKKIEDHTDNFSDNFSLRPESPPPRR